MHLVTTGCPAPYVEAITAQLERRGPVSGAVDGPTVHLVMVDDASTLGSLPSEMAGDDAVIVAVVAELTVEAYTAALVAGAAGVVHVDTSSQITVDVIEAALNGAVLLPHQVAHTMASLAARTRPNVELTASDRELLIGISAGRSVVDLAQERFFSDRTVRRHLQGLYMKLGVQNRAEAIAAAARMNLDT